MKSISYVIDPDGDIELVLNEPNTQKIIPDRVLPGDGDAASDLRFFDRFNVPLRGRYEVFDFDTPMIGFGVKFAEEIPDVVRIRVSSKHLTFASKVFSAMLQGPWAEATSSLSSQQSTRQISTSAWDAKAFAIVLDAIHGRVQKIPRYINLVLLARIATIVDYYQCYESLELLSDVWLSDESVSEEDFWLYTDNSLLRLYVAWVFKNDDIFSTEARRALKLSKGLSEFQLNDLPVGGILELVDKTRTELIGKVLKGLDDLLESLRTENECPDRGELNCPSILFDTLMQEGFGWQNDYGPLTAPYCGHSVNTMLGFIEGIPRPSYHPPYNDYGRSRSVEVNADYLHCSCTIQGRMKALVEEVMEDNMSFELPEIQGWGLR
ncbi:hypothetical protein FPANT_3858 [Fusarium pseudoanthophilum]|uniref:BTB domain-containing protein n=1 Tax=Fusarium pseudoanthophilum TaxID=48495 RepID=A0A8H5PKC8_9HYPO|nr:hypothetical protein FPANT_3858 [Fusarium pseudoanthophilum]